MDGDSPFGEEALRLTGVLAIGEAEDLDVYCNGVREAGVYCGWPEREAARLCNSCQTLIGIGGVPGAFAFPIAGP